MLQNVTGHQAQGIGNKSQSLASFLCSELHTCSTAVDLTLSSLPAQELLRFRHAECQTYKLSHGTEIPEKHELASGIWAGTEHALKGPYTGQKHSFDGGNRRKILPAHPPKPWQASKERIT